MTSTLKAMVKSHFPHTPNIYYLEGMEDDVKVRKLFKKVFNGMGNTVTPYIIGYYKVNNSLVCEVSRGKCVFTDNDIFAVTFLKPDGTRVIHLDKSFDKKEEVFNYINGLKEENVN